MYTGVKQFINQYHQPFNADEKATKKAKAALKARGETSSKKAVEEERLVILAEWQKKTDNGTKAHDTIRAREMKKLPDAVYTQYQKHTGETSGELDAQLESNLERGKTYFEKKVVSNHHHLIGYIDRVDVTKDGFINIEEFKAWEQIYRSSSFVTENGFQVQGKYFFAPINHLQDCNYNEVCLQASLYMYMLWTYNKRLKPGKIKLRHIKLSEEGNIISDEVQELPYMREEVRKLLQNKKINE